jgi:hypothetical protein
METKKQIKEELISVLKSGPTNLKEPAFRRLLLFCANREANQQIQIPT